MLEEIKQVLAAIEKIKRPLQAAVILVALVLAALVRLYSPGSNAIVYILLLSLVPVVILVFSHEGLAESYRFALYVLAFGWSIVVAAGAFSVVGAGGGKEIAADKELFCQAEWENYFKAWLARYEDDLTQLNREVIFPLLPSIETAKSEAEIDAAAEKIKTAIARDPDRKERLKSIVSFLDTVAHQLESGCRSSKYEAYFDTRIYSAYGNFGVFIQDAHRADWPNIVGQMTAKRFRAIYSAQTFSASRKGVFDRKRLPQAA